MSWVLFVGTMLETGEQQGRIGGVLLWASSSMDYNQEYTLA